MLDFDLIKLIKNNRKYLVITVLLLLLGMISNIGITGSVCAILYFLLEKIEFGSIYIYVLLGLLAFIILRFLASILTSKTKDKLGREVKKDLRNRTYDKILKIGSREIGELSTAGLTQVALEGIEQLDLYYSTYIPQFFYSLIAPLLLFLLCIFIDWRVSLVLLCCVPLIPISIVMVSKYAKRVFAKYWGQYTSMGDAFLDSIQGLKELKIFGADGLYHKMINEKSEEFRKITMKVLVMQLASTTIMDLVAFGGAAVGVTISLMDVINNGLNVISALFLILIAVEFFLPLRNLGSAFHVAMNGVSAGKKIIKLLNEEELPWGEKEVNEVNIKIENVSFSYDKNRETLKDINIAFNKKGLYAIVGESGSGKSTIAKLILGAIRADKGEVYIGENKISEVNRSSYYSKIGLVSYNTYIFNESVFENFRLAKEDVTEEEIYNALRKVNLYDFIIENGGLDKTINEGATNISGGQRQRLALAINLVANKDAFIFDEATSNIDIESEEIIIKNIYELSKDKLIILISHRLGNVINADKIFYMEAGRVLESGTHDELIKLDKGYKKLYFAQQNLEVGYKSIVNKEVAL